jgi:hypothetical protein
MREQLYPECHLYLLMTLRHADNSTERPNPLLVPRTPYIPTPYRKRARAITVAALLSLLLGTLGIVVGVVMMVLDLAGSHAFGTNLPAGLQPVFDLAVALGFGTALVLFVGSVMHIAGWYWLWEQLKTGGVLGAINGFNDLIFPAGGGLWFAFFVLPSLGMNIYQMPWLIQTLSAIAIVGILILAMIALGWKTLKD